MSLQYSQQAIDELVGPCAGRLEERGLAGFYKVYCDLFGFHQQPERVYDDFIWRTRRATAPLNNLNDLITYNALYFAQHLARFRQLLTLVQAQRKQQASGAIRLKVIDYGCGQGLASLALLEQLCHRQQVEMEIHLVEPSELSLYAARRYVEAHARRSQRKVHVSTHACTLEQLPSSIFRSHPTTTLHLFSNVLDLAGQPGFNLAMLVEQIRQTPGKHLLLGVSPVYPASHQGFMRLHTYFPHARNLLGNPRITVRIPSDYKVPSISGKSIIEAHGNAMALLLNHR